MAFDPITEAIRTVEDGLDPTDCLTAEEALARVLWVLRMERPVDEGYVESKACPIGAIQALTDWAHSEKGSVPCQGYRRTLEAAGLLSVWV
jgi:hypothetical protein